MYLKVNRHVAETVPADVDQNVSLCLNEILTINLFFNSCLSQKNAYYAGGLEQFGICQI